MDDRQLDLLKRIIVTASAAATDPDLWSPLVDDLNQLFSARGTTLFTPEPATGVAPLGIVCGELSFGLDEYFKHWAHNDAWLKAVEGTGFFQRAGDARVTQEFLSDKSLRKTGFFNDWATRFDAEQGITLKVTDGRDSGAPVMHLTMFRRLQDVPFDKQDKVLLQLLWPHLQRAAQAHWQLQPIRDAARDVECALNVFPMAVWVVRSDFHIEFANAKALDLMQAGSWIVSRANRLVEIGDVDVESLLGKLDDGARTVIVAAASSRQLARGILRVVPVSEAALYARAWPQARALLMFEVAPSQEDHAHWIDYLAHRFNLTPAQSLVLESLGCGLTIQEISSLRRIKLGTVRAHLHELFSKTGQTSQSGLVRLARGG